MSDLAGVTGATGLASNGRSQNGAAAARATHGPVPVNPHPASGVRTPTDIMRQRRDREARKKAEQEARDREQEELERRQMEPQPQPPAQAQAYAAGVAGERTTSQRRGSRPHTAAGPDTQRPISGASPTAQQPPGGSRRPGTAHARQHSGQSMSAPQQPAPLQSPGMPKHPSQVPPQGVSPAQQQQQQQQRRVAFPHAFERWETLSSHWEGLTGYWIRKLEQNNEALERDPVNQQMARQVTDLSAAGANLFHAVVELQRLRASSERKFQRWFFDTRAEQERSKEVQAELERQVRTERQARSDAVTTLQKAESDRTRAEDLLKEMRRELQISKEEARRAWEELGRREQEERDRTNSLRNGEPTLVGGVQVVPMIQGLSGRQPSHQPTQEGPYPGDPIKGGNEPQYYGEVPASPTSTDPFTEGQRAYQESDAQRFTQPPTTSAENPAPYADDDRSYGPSIASSDPGDPEEEYEFHRRGGHGQSHGQSQTQTQSHQLMYPEEEEDSDDYDSEAGGYGNLPSSSVPATSAPLYAYNHPVSSSVDYSGADWGGEQGWESMTPRHHHPTRLSDVLEEDEPRTTPSRASLASRSVQ